MGLISAIRWCRLIIDAAVANFVSVEGTAETAAPGPTVLLAEGTEMKHLTTPALSLSMAAATAAHGQESASDSAIEAIRSVSPALEAYTTDDL